MVVSSLYARALQGSKVWVKLPEAHCQVTAMVKQGSLGWQDCSGA